MIRKRRKSFHKGLAVALSAAMVFGMLPGMGIGNVSATENTSSGQDITAVASGGIEKVSGSAVEGIIDNEERFPEYFAQQSRPYGAGMNELFYFQPLEGTPGEYEDVGYENLLDGTSSKWIVDDFSSTGAYIIFKASEPVAVNGYTIITGDNEDEEGCNPKDWTLYGCNDYGTNSYNPETSWNSIHSVTDDEKLEGRSYEKYTYSLTPPSEAKYQYFKLDITETKGEEQIRMGEFLLDCSVCEHIWRDGETVDATCTEPGYTLTECYKCSLSWTEENAESQPLGHSLVNGICSRCGIGWEKPDCVEDVYQIRNASQLYWFAGLVNGDENVCADGITQNVYADAVLCEDIIINENLSEKLEEDGSVKDDCIVKSWTPIGINYSGEDNGYNGTFNGQGHIIYGLYCDTGIGGLFYENEYEGCIYNIGVADCWADESNYTIMCYYNHGVIANSYVTGILDECYYEGDRISAIAEENNGTVANCYYNRESHNAEVIGVKNGDVQIQSCSGKTTEQFASGEVAYLLSKGYTDGEGESATTYDGSVWGQRIGTDPVPVADSQNKVYATSVCISYSNDAEAVSEKPHQYGEDAVCKNCKAGGKVSSTYLDEKGKLQTVDGTKITEKTLEMTGEDETPSWYVVTGKTTVPERISVQGNVCLILEDNTELIVKGGIQVDEGTSLTIFAQSEGDNTGKLSTQDVPKKCAGIGSGALKNGGIITINGGIINSESTSSGAGIGGGYRGVGGTITINGGTISAESAYCGAGIGGGEYGAGGTITINGGTISAESAYCGAGIGGGEYRDGGTITINGGTISAESAYCGAGIGGGEYRDGGTITISGGIVTARGGEYGAGIGGGEYGAGGTITISGGIVTAQGGECGAGIGNGDEGSEECVFMTQLPDAAESEKGTALIFADSITDSDDTTEWNGLIYNGSNGKIYGNSFILKQNTIIPAEKDITIEEGQIMTIEEDCILNLDAGTGFVNEGTLEVKGMLINHSENDIGKVEGNGQVHTDTDFDGICDDKDCTEKDFRTVNIEGERTINSQGLGEFSLLATVSCIGDTDEKAVYQWYEKDSEGEYNAIKGATATTCSIKKDASGIYEFYLEVTRGSIVQRLPVTVNVNKTRCKVSLTSSLDGDDSEETVALLTGGGLYDTGDSVTVTAYPKDGFVFYEWISETYDEEGDIIWETKSQNPVYTFTASEDVNLVARYRANAKKNLEITGERNSYKVNGVLQGNDVYQKRMKAGSEVTLSYNGTKEFCYWKNDSGKIVSRDINYTFNLVVDTKLTAVTAETGGVTPDNGYLAMVEFISGYGQVMQAETWSSTDNVEKRKLPEAPSRFGGIFRYWSLDGVTQATVETILAAINGTNYHLVLEPVYEMVTTTYSVTVKYPEGSGKEDVLHGNIKAGNTIVVTAQELEGKVFAYWAGDSEGTKILSYEKDYRVRLTDNITLYAIYSDAEVEAKPVIALTNVYKSELGEQKKVSIEVTRSVSDNYEVMETGVLVLFCDEYKEDYYMSVNNSAVRKVTAISTDNQGIYTLNINVTKNPDKKIAARGYMILKDKETCKLTVHYSEIAVTSYNQIP